MIYDISSYHYILFYNIYHDEEYLPPHPPLAIGILLRRSMYYTSLWKETPFIQTTKFRLTSKGPNYKKKDMISFCVLVIFFQKSGRLGQNHAYLPSVGPIKVWPPPQSPQLDHPQPCGMISFFFLLFFHIEEYSLLCCVCIVPNLHIL